MYYSERGVNIGRASGQSSIGNVDGTGKGTKFRACDRFANMRDESVIRRQEFEDQVRSFAYATHINHSPVVAGQVMANVKTQVDKALAEFWKFVGNTVTSQSGLRTLASS
jgi:hypothetical protein